MPALRAPRHHFGRETRPVGLPTRGFTAPNRLRKTDTYLLLAHHDRLRTGRLVGGLVVDLGYGAHPVTTVELQARLVRAVPDIRVLGVELDPERVAAAKFAERDLLEFRTGGFNLPLKPGEHVAAVRAMNVLRQYGEADVAAAFEHLARALQPGALVLEGTSNPSGRLTTFNMFERTDAAVSVAASAAGALFVQRALVFASIPRRGFEPRAFQAVLPKTLIHHAEPGGELDRFFASWENAVRLLEPLPLTPRARALRAARMLAGDGYPVDARPTFVRRGYLVLRGGEPFRRRPRPSSGPAIWKT